MISYFVENDYWLDRLSRICKYQQWDQLQDDALIAKLINLSYICEA